MTKIKEYKPGDILAIPTLKGKMYLFARVMFDYKNQCKKNKSFDKKKSFLSILGSDILDVYNLISDKPVFVPSEVLMKGVNGYIPSPLDSRGWAIVGHIPIEINEVEFQEFISSVDGVRYFIRGEVGIPINGINNLPYTKQLPCSLTNEGRIVDIALSLMGYKDLVTYPPDETEVHLRNADLKKLAKFYSLLDINKKHSYYDFSKLKGFDLSIYYK